MTSALGFESQGGDSPNVVISKAVNMIMEIVAYLCVPLLAMLYIVISLRFLIFLKKDISLKTDICPIILLARRVSLFKY